MSASMQQLPITSPNPQKYSVRLRLKKSPSSTHLNPQSGIISSILKQQNRAHARNVDKLVRLGIEEFGEPVAMSVGLQSERRRGFAYRDENMVLKEVLGKLRKQLKTLTIIGEHAVKNTSQPACSLPSQAHSTFQHPSVQQPQTQATQIQMQHYIITLKQQLNQKDIKIDSLVSKINQLNLEIAGNQEKMEEFNRRCKILEEENRGYEGKLEALENRMLNINSNANINVDKSRRSVNVEQESRKMSQESANSSSIIMGNNFLVDPQGNIIDSSRKYSQKQLLDQIMAAQNVNLNLSGDDSTRRIRILEEKLMENVRKYERLCGKIMQIVNVSDKKEQKQKQQQKQVQIQEKSQKSKQNIDENKVISQLGKIIQQKMSKIREQYNQRQSKFENMISQQLDQALSEVQTLYKSPQKQSEQQQQQQQSISQMTHMTILDKIQYFLQLTKYLLYTNAIGHNPNSNSNQSSPRYQNGPATTLLQILQSRLEQIMVKSQEMKQQFTSNNKILLELCGRVDEMEEGTGTGKEIGKGKGTGMETGWADRLAEVERLLEGNQELWEKQARDTAEFRDLEQGEEQAKSQGAIRQFKYRGMNHKQMLLYLEELENVIRDIQKNQKNVFNRNNNSNHHTKNNDNNGINNEKLFDRQNKSVEMLSKSQNLDQQQQTIQQQQLQQKIQSLKLQYTQQSPEFISYLLQTLLKIKTLPPSPTPHQQILEMSEQIFAELQVRDKKLKQEIGRRRDMLKQRTAAIAQICRKGMRDSSYERSITKD